MRKILLLFALIISSVGISQTTLTLGTGTSTSNQRGPLSRSSSSSSQTLSRVQLLYLASELSSISANSVISQVNFDLGSTNVLTATGDATLKIYMKNSNLATVVDNTLWTTVSTGSTLVGTYTFNLANNFPGAEGFVNFVLNTGFVYTGGSLEISTEWDSSTLTVVDGAFPNTYFTGDGSLKWHYTNTTHGSSIDRTSSSSLPSTLTGVNTSRVNTQLVHANADPSSIKTHSIGTSTSSSATRGPIQRGDDGSTSLYSRNNLVYTSTELLADLTSNALISAIDFDLGSTNIITASGDATIDIYMKNSAIVEAPASEDWTNIISGATLVGSYTFNTTNNFPGVEGFLTFNLDTDFEYTGGTLEVSVEWNSGGLTVVNALEPNVYFSGNGSLNWHWTATSHNSVLNRSGTSSAPTTLNSQKAERVNTRFTFKEMTTSTWDGSTDSEWTTGDNWSSGFAPSDAVSVTIGVTGNNPVINGSTGAETRDLTVAGTASLTIQSGGSLIVGGTSSGDITYNVAIPDGNWHKISSPVTGETYGGATSWIGDNLIKTGGNTDNRGIATYQNGTPDGTTGPWTYYSASTGTETPFDSGKGYSMIATGATTYNFVGTYPTLPNSPTITQGANSNNWNLIGNPTPAYIDVAAYITANSGSLSADAFQALYVYSLGGGYVGLNSGYIHPGQGFFVNSNVASGTVSTTAAMLSHQTGVTFLKGGNPSIELTITEGISSRKTSLEYISNGTLGLDPGKDIGKFNGVNVPLNIYTNLLENNEGIAFQKQALPNSDIETMIISIGVKAASGKEITISGTSLNLPDGIKVILEDRELNVFTNLDEGDYKITLSEAIDGVGRFYLHTANKALSVDDNLALDNISIYKTNASTLRIVGLQQGKASVKFYNVLGKQIMTSSFETTNRVKDISLPNLATGVYIVQLETEAGKLNKKIILE
jgi:hypothetical protein